MSKSATSVTGVMPDKLLTSTPAARSTETLSPRNAFAADRPGFPFTISSLEEETDLSRRRYQKPKVFKENGFWKIRIREDAIRENGTVYRAKPQYVIGPCRGPNALTERQAQKDADEHEAVKRANAALACSNSVITLAQFYDKYFFPEVVEKLKHSGKEHYKYCSVKVKGFLGTAKLRDVTSTAISKMCTKLEESGYSPKTVSHIKTATATIFNYAKKKNFYSGDNPASLVTLAEVTSPERLAYSPEQARRILELLPSPVREAVFLSVTTSLNVAELCGLRRKRVNLSSSTIWSGGETIPPCSLLVREQYYRNRWGTVKKQAKRRLSSRYRTIGIPDYLIELLQSLMDRSGFKLPDHPVFASRNGTPIDAHNVNNRLFKKIQDQLGIPVSWHLFRHSAASFAEALGMPLSDRVALMGHASARMTEHYTHSDVDRRRQEQNKIADLLMSDKDKNIRQLMAVEPMGPKQ